VENKHKKETNKFVGSLGCTTCFSSLGISSRMAIYKYLRLTGKSTVNGVVAQIGLTQPTISYHLNEMKNAGILKSERSGKEVYYMIDDECKIYHTDCVLKEVNFPESKNVANQ
jgi:DNA-binding transcriptional ArsR family regulator